jgi:predicted AAA+ superfamily ATPase
MGRLFEQWIITQTLAFIRYNKVESNLYYWRTNHGAEVDLLIEKHGKITAAIEIKLSENITGAHVSGIKSLKEEYPKTPCFLICSAKNAFTLHNIRILPWQKYLEELKVIVE